MDEETWHNDAHRSWRLSCYAPPQLCNGWGVKLSFRNPLFPNWKLRRFELTHYEFRYEDEEHNVKNSIPRGSLIHAEPVPLSEVPNWQPLSFTKNYPHAIRIWFGQKQFFFAVATESLRDRWLEALNS